MKVLLLSFLLSLGGVLYFASAPDVSWVDGTASWVNESSPKIQNELVARMVDVKKAWENAVQWGEEMGSKVRAGLKEEFDQLMRNSPTADKHERENES